MISADPIERFPEDIRERLTAHWRVGDALDASQLVEAVRGLGDADVLVLDVGTLPPSAPSTIVDCTGPEPVVLRQGAVPTERLRCAIPEVHGE